MKHYLTAIMILCIYGITSGQYASQESGIAHVINTSKNASNDMALYKSGTFGHCVSENAKGLSTCTIDALVQHLSESIEYPDSAIEYGLQNTCQVSFIINKSGNSTAIKVSQCPKVFFEQPIVTALSQLNWQPVVKMGEAINYGVQLNVQFQ